MIKINVIYIKKMEQKKNRNDLTEKYAKMYAWFISHPAQFN